MQDAVNAAICSGCRDRRCQRQRAVSEELISPANCNDVVAVTAHTINGENADYANIDARVTLSAPGGGPPVQLGTGGHQPNNTSFDGYYIHSAVLFGPTTPTSATASGSSGPAYAGFTGTSAATPHVAGVAALIKSALPTATPADIRSILSTRQTCAHFLLEVRVWRRMFMSKCGMGMLDAQKAIAGCYRRNSAGRCRPRPEGCAGRHGDAGWKGSGFPDPIDRFLRLVADDRINGDADERQDGHRNVHGTADRHAEFQADVLLTIRFRQSPATTWSSSVSTVLRCWRPLRPPSRRLSARRWHSLSRRPMQTVIR